MKKLLYIINILFLICCTNQSPQKLWDEANIMRDANRLKECIINLESIIVKFPKHDLAAKAQFQKAEIYLNDIKDFDFAIEEFDKVINQFPNHDVSKNSLFMIAYIYNNYLSSYTDAIEKYKLFKHKYPDDELIPSVEYELEGLYKMNGVIDSLNSILIQKMNI